MCLINIGYDVTAKHKLVVAANRDEYYARPSARVSFWREESNLAAGRDLVRGGTWFGVTRGGRFAAVTNFRNPSDSRKNEVSRGKLVLDFLLGEQEVERYAADVLKRGEQTRGYNLLVYDGKNLGWISNQINDYRLLGAGIYGLSNAHLDTPWPKVERTKSRFGSALSKEHLSKDRLFEIFADQAVPPDHELPDTGVGLEWERILAPPFICSSEYGTRCSTVLTMSNEGEWSLVERSYNSEGDLKTITVLNNWR